MFDRLRSWFRSAPKPAKRSYTAARLGGGNVLGTLYSHDQEVKADLLNLRRNSRQTAQNNPFMRRYLRTLGGQIVGPRGLTLQSQAPGVYAKRIEAAFLDWGKRGSASANQKYTWGQIQRLFIRTMALDGECFVRRVWNRGRHGFALQFIDADLLDHNLNQDAGNGKNAIVMGVEVDAFGAAVAYHFGVHGNGSTGYYPQLGIGRTERVPVEDIWHGVDPERVNQTRGVPWTSSAMFLLDMLGHYWESEVAAARHESERLGFLVSDIAEVDDPDETQLTTTQLADQVPGAIRYMGLPPGVKTEFPDIQHPTTAFAEFSRSMLKGIASGLGIDYASLSSDLTQVSFSSIRKGTLDDREYYQEIQNDQLIPFADWVFTSWFDAAPSAGAVALPADHGHQCLFPHTWTPRGWGWVDPKADASSRDSALRNRTTSRTRILAEQGIDFDDVLAELVEEEAQLKAVGLDPLEATTPKSAPAEDPALDGGPNAA